MQVTDKTHLQNRIQTIVFISLFLVCMGLLAWLSTRYTYHADWTADGRNTLSESSQMLLDRIEGNIDISAYAREAGIMRKHVSEVIGRYQRYKPGITLTFINPDTVPDKVRELGITQNGELVFNYKGRSEKIQDLSEQSITNALQRVVRSGERYIVFLEGHGERQTGGRANHDLGDWVQHLERKGINVLTLNLASSNQIPANTTALVIASPQVNLLPGEVKIISDYVNKGGNLFWLHEPGPTGSLEPLAESLGIEALPGTLVDPLGQAFGINNPSFIVIAEYGQHAITRDFNTISLFPQTCALDYERQEGWVDTTFLESSARSWNETGKLEGALQFDKGADTNGPLPIAIALTRETNNDTTPPADNDVNGEEKLDPVNTSGRQQRVVFVCDGDFLSNSFMGNGGNLELGLNIINWLSNDDSFISIKAKTAHDLSLDLSQTASLVIGFGFLLALPLLLVGSGLLIWLRRRKR